MHRSRSSGPADTHCGSVGADLRPGAAQLRRIEAERDDRVGALALRLLDESLRRVLAPLGEHLRHALELTADERLERRADLGSDVARADREPEDLAEDLFDSVTREV